MDCKQYPSHLLVEWNKFLTYYSKQVYKPTYGQFHTVYRKFHAKQNRDTSQNG